MKRVTSDEGRIPLRKMSRWCGVRGDGPDGFSDAPGPTTLKREPMSKEWLDAVRASRRTMETK